MQVAREARILLRTAHFESSMFADGDMYSLGSKSKVATNPLKCTRGGVTAKGLKLVELLMLGMVSGGASWASCCWSCGPFGDLSSTSVQRLAAKAVADHADSPGLLKQLAGLGTNGKHSSNIDRDLRALVQRLAPDVPEPVDVMIPMEYKRFIAGPAVELTAAHSIHPPFAWFSFLYNRSEADFRARFLGGATGDMHDALEQFWAGVPDVDPRKVHRINDFRKRAD